MAGRPTKRRKASKPSRMASIETKDVENTQETVIDTPLGEEVELPDLAMVTDSDMNTPEVREYMQDLAFMNDKVTVIVGESIDDNAENPVPVGVNGEIRLFTRGQEYTVERKFVESLIKREDTVRTVQYKDDDNCDQTRIVSKPALKYPVSILNDPAGDTGRRWFKHTCDNAW